MNLWESIRSRVISLIGTAVVLAWQVEKVVRLALIPDTVTSSSYLPDGARLPLESLFLLCWIGAIILEWRQLKKFILSLPSR